MTRRLRRPIPQRRSLWPMVAAGVGIAVVVCLVAFGAMNSDTQAGAGGQGPYLDEEHRQIEEDRIKREAEMDKDLEDLKAGAREAQRVADSVEE